MKSLVLKPFAYSTDGVRSSALRPGHVLEIRDDLAAGLVQEGFIEAHEPKPKAKGRGRVPSAGQAGPANTDAAPSDDVREESPGGDVGGDTTAGDGGTEPVAQGELRAVHKGRGKWSIVNEAGKEVSSGLTGDEAKKLVASPPKADHSPDPGPVGE